MTKLLDFYTDVLDYCNIVEGDDQFLSAKSLDGETEQSAIQVGDKKILLPRRENFKGFDAEKTLMFHPLREYIERGESDLVKRLRRCINIRINVTTFCLMSELIGIIASPAQHAKLSPEQRELILGAAELDAKSTELYIKVIGKLYTANPTAVFANLYLKKAGTYRGERHARVGVVNFGFYEQFKAVQDNKGLRAAEKEGFPKVFQFMFPGTPDDLEAYNSYSDSRTAPWFECLLRTSYVVTSRLNELIDLYEPFLSKETRDCRFNHDWVETLDNLDSLSKEIALIPMQQSSQVQEEEPAPKPAPKAVPVPEAREERRDPRDDRRDDRRDLRDDRYDDRDRYDNRREPRPSEPKPESNEEGVVTFDQVMRNSEALQRARFARSPITDYLDRGPRRDAPSGWGDRWDSRDARRDPRDDPRYDPRRDPRYDPRYDDRRDPRYDPRYDDRRDLRYDPRFDDRRDPRDDPRYDPRRDPRYDPRYDDPRFRR